MLMSGSQLVYKTDLQTFVGPTETGQVQDPLAVTRLDNRLYFYFVFFSVFVFLSLHLKSRGFFFVL